MPIVAVSMPDSNLKALERIQKQGGFSNRSEVIRHALQALIVEYQSLDDLTGEATTVITVVYGKSGKDLECSRIQHRNSHLIEALLHAHSTDGTCLDVMVAKGKAEQLQHLVKAFNAQRTVTQVQVNILGGS